MGGWEGNCKRFSANGCTPEYGCWRATQRSSLKRMPHHNSCTKVASVFSRQPRDPRHATSLGDLLRTWGAVFVMWSAGPNNFEVKFGIIIVFVTHSTCALDSSGCVCARTVGHLGL